MQTMQFNGVTSEYLSIDELTLIHRQTTQIDSWLLDTFFTAEKGFNNDLIPVGELSIGVPLAPFVARGKPGREMDIQVDGSVTMVRPAYMKPKYVVSPVVNNIDMSLIGLLRKAGIVASSGELSLAEKMRVAQAMAYQQAMLSIANRRIMMAAELVINGTVTVSSDDAEPFTVSYGKDPAAAFTPANLWNNALATPVADIQTMLDVYQQYNNGEPATRVITTSNVFSALRKHQDFNDVFSETKYTITPELQGGHLQNRSRTQAIFRGSFSGVEFWTYDAVIGGTGTRIIPNNRFVVQGMNAGFRAYGPIAHFKAGGQVMPEFAHQWVDDNSGSFNLTVESSFLPVPPSKNSFVSATVL